MAQEPPKHEEIVEASPDPVPPLTPTVYMFTTCGGPKNDRNTTPSLGAKAQGEHADGQKPHRRIPVMKMKIWN